MQLQHIVHFAGKAVQRREAMLLLRKITSFPEVQPFSCVYLTQCLGDYTLHVKTDYDCETKVIIKHVALQRGLVVREETGGFLAIFAPQRELLKLTA